MDRPEPQAEQGLGREAERNERGVGLGGYDASDGKTIGSLMRLFRRFLTARFSEYDPHRMMHICGLDEGPV